MYSHVKAEKILRILICHTIGFKFNNQLKVDIGNSAIGRIILLNYRIFIPSVGLENNKNKIFILFRSI